MLEVYVLGRTIDGLFWDAPVSMFSNYQYRMPLCRDVHLGALPPADPASTLVALVLPPDMPGTGGCDGPPDHRSRSLE